MSDKTTENGVDTSARLTGTVSQDDDWREFLGDLRRIAKDLNFAGNHHDADVITKAMSRLKKQRFSIRSYQEKPNRVIDGKRP